MEVLELVEKGEPHHGGWWKDGGHTESNGHHARWANKFVTFFRGKATVSSPFPQLSGV